METKELFDRLKNSYTTQYTKVENEKKPFYNPLRWYIYFMSKEIKKRR